MAQFYSSWYLFCPEIDMKRVLKCCTHVVDSSESLTSNTLLTSHSRITYIIEISLSHLSLHFFYFYSIDARAINKNTHIKSFFNALYFATTCARLVTWLFIYLFFIFLVVMVRKNNTIQYLVNFFF